MNNNSKILEQHQYISILTKCFIYITQNYYSQSLIMQYLFILINQLQPIIYLIRVNVSTQLNNIQYLPYFEYLLRPLQNIYPKYNICIYIFVVILILMSIHLIIMAYLYRKELLKNLKSFTVSTLIENSWRINQNIFQLFTLCILCLTFILIIPFTEQLIIILSQQFTDNNLTYIAFIDLFSLIFLLIVVILYQFISAETPHLTNHGFQLINQTIFMAIKVIFQFTQIIIYLFLEDTNSAQIMQFILIIAIIIVQLYDLFANLPFSDTLVYYLILLAHTLNINVVIFKLIFIHLEQYQETSVILLFGLVFYILINIIDKRINAIIYFPTEDSKTYQFRLVVLQNEDISNHWEDRAKLFGQHRSTCKKVNCFCNRNFSLELFNPKLNKHYQFLVKKLVNHFGHILNKKSNFSYKFYFHYISALSQIGQATHAFQQLSQLTTTDRSLKKRTKTILDSSAYNSSNSNTQRTSRFALQPRDLQENSHHTDQIQQLDQAIQRIPSEMSFIERCKYEILLQEVRCSIQLNLSNLSIEQSSLSQLIQTFLQSEQSTIQVYQDLQYFLKMKLLLINQICDPKSSGDLLLRKTIEVNMAFEKFEQNLQRQYDFFPSQRVQNILSFTQAELRNNYFNAYKTMNNLSIKDDKVFKALNQNKLNLFDKDVAYLKIEVETDFNLKIKETSTDAYKVFGFEKSVFKKIEDLSILIPLTVAKIHNSFVEDFLQNGLSKYYTNSNMAFCQNQNRLVQQIDLFFDINFQETNNFAFITFVTQNQTDASYIFVSQDGQIGGVSQNIFHRLGLSSKMVEVVPNILRMNIDQLIPDFDQLIISKSRRDTNDMLTVDDQILIEQENINLYFPHDQHFNSATTLRYPENGNLNQYQVSIRIYCRLIQKQTYYIIELVDIRRNLNNLSISYVGKKTEFDEIESIIVSEDFKPNQPLEMHLQEFNLQQYNLVNEFFDGFKQKAGDISKVPNIQNDIDAKQFVSLVSPHSTKRILLDNQQQFFKDAEGEIELDNKLSSGILFKNAQSSEEINQNINKLRRQNNDPLQIQDLMKSFYQQLLPEKIDENNNKYNNDQQSQIQSVTAFKASKYFQKYAQYNTIINSNELIWEKQLGLCSLFIGIILILISQIILITMSQNDFQNIREEIDLLKIRKMVMGPLSASIASEQIQNNYNVLLENQIITKSEYNQLIIYIDSTRQSNFELMHKYFNFMLSNQHVEQLLYSITTEVTIVDNPDSMAVKSEMNLREILVILLASQQSYQTNAQYDYLVGPINLYYFSVANYANLFDEIEHVGHEFLYYTQNTAITIRNKWDLFIISMLCIIVFTIILSGYLEIQNVSQLEKIFEFKSFINKAVLQKEQDRLSILSNILDSNREIIYNYQFNLEQKEEYLSSLEKKQIFVANKYTKDKIHLNVYKLKTLIYYFLIVGILMTYFLTVLTSADQYLDQYHATTEYVFASSEIVSIISTTYIVKELAFNSKLGEGYTYLGEESHLKFEEICAVCVDHYNEFLDLAYNIKNINMLGGTTFKSLFNIYQGHNLCDLFTGNYKTIAEFICDFSLEGNIKLGFIPSLLYIRQRLIEDLETSFDNRTLQQYPINEIEGALTTSEAINIISETLAGGLDSATQDIQYLENTLTIFFIIGLILYLLSILIYLIPKYQTQQKHILSFIMHVPIYTMILENQYERAIRQFCIKQGWI